MEKWSQKIDFNNIADKYGTPIYIFNQKHIQI